MLFKLPELPFAYDSLEPYISAETLRFHHDKHHQAYVDNANKAMEGIEAGFEGLCAGKVLKRLAEIPEDRRQAVRNNVGGHANHNLLWKCMKAGCELKGILKEAIERDFGSVENFKQEFINAAMTQFGSGWAWLVLTKENKLAVVKTANQDNPLMGKEIAGVEGIPLLLVDVWEHSYYIDYQNRRAEYLEKFWNVINWDYVEQRLINRGCASH